MEKTKHKRRTRIRASHARTARNHKTKKHKKRGELKLIILAGIVFLLAMLSLAISNLSWRNISLISGFDQCVRAGYPILESYPPSCQTPDGRVFSQQLPLASTGK